MTKLEFKLGTAQYLSCIFHYEQMNMCSSVRQGNISALIGKEEERGGERLFFFCENIITGTLSFKKPVFSNPWEEREAIHHHPGYLHEMEKPEYTPGADMKESDSPFCPETSPLAVLLHDSQTLQCTGTRTACLANVSHPFLRAVR